MDQDVASTYQPPVSLLLRLGEPDKSDAEVDYSAHGLGREHVPDLIRLMTDDALNDADQDSNEVWAPLHAWRALGQLRAEEAIRPLLGLLDKAIDNEWVLAEVPDVLAQIGPAMLEPSVAYLADPANDRFARVGAADAIASLGDLYPETRERCVAALIRQMERYEDQPMALNDTLIQALLQFKAVEAAPILEKAFASGRLDDSLYGDWEDAQIQLGLKTERQTERRPNRWTELGETMRAASGIGEDEANPFFVVMPGKSLARLRFSEGERAGQVWEVSLSACSDPMCPCWMVGFVCRPEGDADAVPLAFPVCAEDRHLIEAPEGEEGLDVKGWEFGREVVAAFREPDWRRLADFCSWDKERLTEEADVEDMAGEFPEKLTGADLATYEEVFPFARQFLFECGGHQWKAQDIYCIDHKCGCTEVDLVFLAVDDADNRDEPRPEDEGGLLMYDYRKGRIGKMAAGHPGHPPVRELLAALLKEHPDFRETVERRHADLRYLNVEAMRARGRFHSVTRESPKVGRNDPCPCGSGKKYKKCCGG